MGWPRLAIFLRRASTCAIAVAACLAAAGCARAYVPKEPKIATSETTNALVESLRVNPALKFEVHLRVAARPGARLWDARFAVSSDRPCSTGKALAEIEADGSVIQEGPLDIGGLHDLALTFQQGYPDQGWRKSMAEPSFVDLSVEDPARGRVCVRIPVMGGAAPIWRIDHDGEGFLLHLGGRVFPLGIASASETRPSGSFFQRLGITSDSFRTWVEVGAVFTGSEPSHYLVLTPGVDGAFWQGGPWALRAGLGYDVAFNFYRPSPNETGAHRYTLQGPRATLGLSLGLIQNLLMPSLSTHPFLPAGQRTLSLEFEVPVSVWFGAGDAPRTIVVPGAGFGIFWAF